MNPNSDQPVNGSITQQLSTRFAATIASLILGVIVGLLAVGFLKTVAWASSHWASPLPVSFAEVNWHFSPWVGMALLLSALATGQILKLLDNGRPHGPADLINATQNNHALDLKQGYLSSLIALINLSGGASVGLFGPLVHLGGCISTSLQKMLIRLPRGVVLGSGAGAAIAAVFAAPLGAAIFALEAIIRRFGMFGSGPVLACTFSAYWVSEYFLGDHRFFHIGTAPNLEWTVLLAAVGIGVASGIVSSLYIYAVTAAPKMAKASGVALHWQPLVPALVLFLLSPILPHLLGSGISSIQLAMAGKLALSVLLVLVVAKILMTSLCIGFGFFGGVFGPALYFGALLGAVVDLLVTDAGGVGSSYALLAAASCVAAVIGAPVAATVIIFEMTGSYGWAVLSMISVVVSCQISRSFVGRSIFDRQLELRGIAVDDDSRLQAVEGR
jgi:CIC family chloride channel protein